MGRIKDLWKNKKLIIEGMKNSIIKKEVVEEVASERMKVCKECPHMDTKGDSCFVPKTQPCCSLCGCTLNFKLRALSAECDDKRWPSLMTEDEEDELNFLTDDN